MREKKYKARQKFFYTAFVGLKRKKTMNGCWVNGKNRGQQRAGNFPEIGRCLHLSLSPYLAFPRPSLA